MSDEKTTVESPVSNQGLGESEILKFIREQAEIISELKNKINQLENTEKTPVVADTAKAEDPLKNINISEKSKISTLKLPKKVSIKHFIDPDDENMGLRDMGMAMMDGEGGRGGFKERFGWIEKAGIKYYLTGFEEPSRNIEKFENLAEKEAYMKELQKTKEVLESIYGVDLSNRNYDFWKNLVLEVRSPIKSLNMTEPNDILIYYGILGGAIDGIAPSYETALETNKRYKHYLHIDDVVEKQKIGIKRERNRAIAMLEDLYSKGESDKLLMISKVVLPITKGFTKKDSIDRLYNDLNDYINGINVPTDKKITPSTFMRAAANDLENLTIRAVVNDAIYHKLVRQDDTKTYYNTASGTPLGKTVTDLVAFCSNEANNHEFVNLYERVNTIWQGN